jgi:hypothetical protein
LIAIKKSFSKTMSPYSAAAAAWAALRLLPWIIATFFEKFLEFDRRSLWAGKPTFFKRRRLTFFQSAAFLLK